MDSAFVVFICAFNVAGLASVAALLRSTETLKLRIILASFLNSGMLGLGVALLWYNKYFEDLYFLIGLSLIVGLTGLRGVEIGLGWAQKIAATVLKLEETKKEEPKP